MTTTTTTASDETTQVTQSGTAEAGEVVQTEVPSVEAVAEEAPLKAAETQAEQSASPEVPDTTASDEPKAPEEDEEAPEEDEEAAADTSSSDFSQPTLVTGIDAAALQQRIADIQARHNSLLQAKADAEHALTAIQAELEDACTELENFAKSYGGHLKEVTDDIKARFNAGRSWLARHL